jgi:Family of unknown function (DUF6368)
MAGPVHCLITQKLTDDHLDALQVFFEKKKAHINEYRENDSPNSRYWDLHLRDPTVRRPREENKHQPEPLMPFLITLSDLTTEEIAGYRSTVPPLDLDPASRIEVAAMVNNLISRRWMAQLEIDLIEIFGGYVDLLAVIYPPSSNLLDNTILQEQEETIMDYIKNVPGRVCQRYYDIEPGFIRGFTQVVDREFLENWLQDDRFHFAK